MACAWQSLRSGYSQPDDNPKWRAQWKGKELFQNGDYNFSVVKGPNANGDPHKADGISGATITCNGVDWMLRYWMSDEG